MKFTLYFIFLLFTQPLLCQDIEWSEERKLDFSDFKRISFTEDGFSSAESSVAINFRIVSTSIWTGKIKIKIFAVFNSENSWFRKEQSSNIYVLNHEQKHFDVAYAFATQLQKTVDKEIRGITDFNNRFQKLYDKAFAEYIAFQTKYDLDTGHGSNLEEQIKYNDIISKMIK
ncbi:hypothetical protein [Chryseobacterium aurantiacum]|uniref:hypothetical protein n=1 Tax=Chryseobacterium aurantiacum TaxID=2116499 RepID=UPI000D11E323|nr:hypothetical protein [Chryseobacterium aurantiacum]